MNVPLADIVAKTRYRKELGDLTELAKSIDEIGLLNPPLPVDGHIAPPETPGWGAEWDRAYFAKKRVAEW